MNRFRVLGPARRELAGILDYSRRRYGAETAQRYETLVLRGFNLVRTDPLNTATRAVDPSLDGFRSLHLRYVPQGMPRAVRSPRHFIIYRFNLGDVAVVRILHEKMDVLAQLG